MEYESNICDGLGIAIGMIIGVFYADDVIMGSQDPEWIQGAINELIGIFHRVRLMANIEKSKTMTCHLGKIRTGISEEAFSWRIVG